MIKLIVLDVDGTLVDTDDIILFTWKKLIELYKPKDFSLADEVIKTFSGPPLKDSLLKVFPEYDLNFMINEYNRVTLEFYPSKIHTFKDSIEVVNRLSNEGYKLAILSSKDGPMIRYTLKMAGFDLSLFSVIVSCDDVKKPKPNPEGLLYIMNKLGIKNNETISVGDTEYDYYCANNANVKVIMMDMKKRVFKSKLFPLAFCSNYNELYKEIKNYDNK